MAATTAIAFRPEEAIDGGRRRAQRWAAVDAATGAPVPARRVFAELTSSSSSGGSDVGRVLLEALQVRVLLQVSGC